MGSLNKATLIGHLGKDPEVRTIPSGSKVANFSIATTESYTDKNGQKVEKTEWHNIVMWRGLAEIAEKYLRKGSQVYVEGRLTTRSWDDQNGQKRYTTEIVVDNLVMLGKGGGGGGGGRESAPAGEDNYRSEPAMSQTRSQGPAGRPSGGYSGGSSLPPQAEDDLPF